MNEELVTKIDLKKHEATIMSRQSEVAGHYVQYVLKPREAEIKKALIKLGWTPPEEPSQPSSVGEWVISGSGGLIVYVTEKPRLVSMGNGRDELVFYGIPLNGIKNGAESFEYIEKEYHLHILTEADLPDCPFCEDKMMLGDSDKNIYWTCCKNPRCDWDTPEKDNAHDTISIALKVAIGQKLLERVGV